MNDIALSIVMPIYNAEKYIEECIDSILKQSFKDFELILIDDGSTDSSSQIVDRYAAKDQRIKVVHQENMGSIAARENGMKLAVGKYVTLADSDDWMDKDMYEHMMQLATDNDADIVAIGFTEEREDGSSTCCNGCESGVYKDEKLKKLKEKVIYDGVFFEPGIMATLWSKIFRRSLILSEHRKPASPIVKMGEDASISYPCIARAQAIVIDNEFYSYHYRMLQSSMAHSYDTRFFERADKLFEGLYDNLKDYHEMIEQLKVYKLFITQIGAEQLISPRNKESIVYKGKKLKEYLTQYHYWFDDVDVDWSKFEPNTSRELQAIINKQAFKFMVLYYKRKILCRLSGREA